MKLDVLRPQLETPFKCYVYCTQGDGNLNDTLMSVNRCYVLNGKIIGEFICEKIDTYSYHKGLTKFGGSLGLPIGTYDTYLIFEDDYKDMCLTYDKVKDYGKGKTLYGWHISDLKIYDEPKELGEFISPCKDIDCYKCQHWEYFLDKQDGYCNTDSRIITRPFQSWGYCEELSE